MLKVTFNFVTILLLFYILLFGFKAQLLDTQSNPHLHWNSSPNLWTTREVPELGFEFWILSSCPGVSHLFLCFWGRNNKSMDFQPRGGLAALTPISIKGKCTFCIIGSHIPICYLESYATLEYLTYMCVFGIFLKIIMKEEINQLCTCFWSKQISGNSLGRKGKIS